MTSDVTPNADSGTRCWEDGGGSTCLLPDGHDGPHQFTPDNQIVVQLAGEVTCADCQRAYVCTPWDDHYEPAWGGPRVCYPCLLRQHATMPPTDGSGSTP